jgi:hypothetical protein
MLGVVSHYIADMFVQDVPFLLLLIINYDVVATGMGCVKFLLDKGSMTHISYLSLILLLFSALTNHG